MNERRTAWILVFLLVAQLLLVAAQVPAAAGNRSQLEVGALSALAPLARLAGSLARGVGGLKDWLRQRQDLRTENRDLKRENLELRLEMMRLRDVESQLRQVAGAVRYAPPESAALALSDVLYIDHSSWIRTLVLYSPGTRPEVDQPVLTSAGLVGRVILVAGPYVKVQLITDRAASVGAMVERTRRQALVQGTARGGLELTYLPSNLEVRLGDRVVTSGVDGIFPRGIDVGTVAEIGSGHGLFHEIRLSPAVDFGAIDHVYLLRYSGPPAEVRKALPGQAEGNTP